MLNNLTKVTAWTPGRLFYVGLAIVLLAMGLPFIPAWYTFIHMWRVELAASIFLGSALVYLYLNYRPTLHFPVYPDELKFVVLPILAFILWSALSIAWAPSWKSAVHHSLIWAEYLLFYLLFRQAVTRGANVRKLLGLLVLTLVYFALPAIAEYCAYMYFGGKSTLGMRYAKFGEQVVTILPLVLLVVVRARGKMFVMGAAATALLWLLVFCTLGRANYLLFGCVIFAMFVCLSIAKTHRRYLPKFALLVATLVIVPLPLQLFSVFSTESTISTVSRFTDSGAMDSSNNVRKLMFSISMEMLRAHPIEGIGADNFGMQFNRYREVYGSAHPHDVNLAGAEEEIASHAHNEFLQIVAELGIVGGAILLWLLAGISLMAFRALKRLRQGSVYELAAVIGLSAFLASSLVSAYSFRVMQNGIMFFFVLAFAASRTLRPNTSEAPERHHVRVAPSPSLIFATGLLLCAGLAGYSVVRVSSAIVATKANQTRPLASAISVYETSMRLDDENPDVQSNLGMRLFRARRYQEAATHLQSSVAIGRATSAELSYLASAQSLSGDNVAAETTMAYAAALYPRSPFVLTRYSIILEENGKAVEAAEVFLRAVAIDQRSAITWRVMITSGPKAVSDLAARDTAYHQVMYLRPESSIYAVVTERFTRFPEERRFSFATASQEEE